MKKIIFPLFFVCCVLLFLVFHEDIIHGINRVPFFTSVTSHVMGVEPANTTVSSAGSGYYAYETLTEAEQLIYNQMADCLLNYKEKTTLSTNDGEEADHAFQCLTSDHPEIFWISAYELTTYQLSGIESEFVFCPVYTMSQEEIEQYQEEIELSVDEQYLTGALDNMTSEYQKAKYLYDTLISNIDYNRNAENNQNICSVFINGESVCMGYSKAYQYLLQKCGIVSAIVTGRSANEDHAWNLVELDGEYCYIDTTWGDPQFSSTQAITTGYVDYNFFGMTTEDLLKTHTINNLFTLPQCDSENLNYFHKEGLYISEFDKTALEQMISSHIGDNAFITVRCKDEKVYREVFRYLIKESKIYDYIQKNPINYTENTTYHTLTIFCF